MRFSDGRRFDLSANGLGIELSRSYDLEWEAMIKEMDERRWKRVRLRWAAKHAPSPGTGKCIGYYFAKRRVHND